MRNRAQRRHNTRRVINRQLAIAKKYSSETKGINQPGRFAKHNAMNCGNPNCVFCANPRRTFNEKTIQERKAELAMEDVYE